MPIDRRNFIGAAALAGPALMRGGASASDRVRAAVIGVGGRGRDHMRLLAKQNNVEVVAFCDPDQTRLDERCAEFEKLTGKRPRLEQDLRRIVDDRTIDVVTIATCNHWHALSAIWAMQAGKHVYVEKPVCQDRKSTRLNSSHSSISYAVFCLKKKKKKHQEYIYTNSKNKTLTTTI